MEMKTPETPEKHDKREKNNPQHLHLDIHGNIKQKLKQECVINYNNYYQKKNKNNNNSHSNNNIFYNNIKYKN